MDEVIRKMCKTNPTLDLPCPICNKKHTFKTIEFFAKPTYKFLCPDCNKTTEYDTTPFVADFKKLLKSLKIK